MVADVAAKYTICKPGGRKWDAADGRRWTGWLRTVCAVSLQKNEFGTARGGQSNGWIIYERLHKSLGWQVDRQSILSSSSEIICKLTNSGASSEQNRFHSTVLKTDTLENYCHHYYKMMLEDINNETVTNKRLMSRYSLIVLLSAL